METRSEPRLSDIATHLTRPTGISGSDFTRLNRVAAKCGIHFDRWQQGVLWLLLAKRADGRYACGEGGLVLSSCRQIGKTYTIGNAVFLMCVTHPNLTAVWTAHHTRTSDQTFADLCALERHPLLGRYIDRIRRANGQQEIRFKNGARIMFGARERGFGRGLHSVDVEVFDEAQILTQSALDNMVAIVNTSPNPLVVFMGNPPKPGDVSEAFEDKRRTALNGVDGIAYIELSADKSADLDDRAQWAKANPSYPKRTSAEAMLRMRNLLSDDSFRREALGIWDDHAASHAIDPTLWRQAGVDTRRDGGAVSFAIDMPPDRTSIAIGACMRYADKSAHIELARFENTDRHGIAWAVDWIAERWPRTCSVVIDSQSPATVLVQDLKQRGVRVTLTNSTDMGQACGRFTDMLRDGALHHLNGQEALDIAVKGATKRNIGQSGAFGWNKRTSDVDISPLVAVTLALHGACTTRRNPLEIRRMIRLP